MTGGETDKSEKPALCKNGRFNERKVGGFTKVFRFSYKNFSVMTLRENAGGRGNPVLIFALSSLWREAKGEESEPLGEHYKF